MRRSDKWSGLPPIQKIHLPEKNILLRVVLLTAAIILAAVSLVKGLNGLLNQEPGWQEIEAQTQELSYSQEFILQYDLGGKGVSATVEKKALTDLYSDLMEQAYGIFSPDASVPGVRGIRYLSDHPNETVQVEPALYEALSLVKEYDSRYLYLAPAYVEQNRIFRFDRWEEAAQYDPAQNNSLQPYLMEIASFASDPNHIDVELLGGSQAVLHVSQDYLDFLQDNEIEYLLDFSWMRNAFIVDWIAEELSSRGYIMGSVSTFDGFSRNLDSRENTYSYNLFDRMGETVNIPGVLQYRGPMAFAFFRNYPLGEQDRYRYIAFPDGHTASLLLDSADGLCRSAEDNLVLYSGELGCSELALLGGPLFIADSLDREALVSLPVFALWGEEDQILYTQKDAVLEPGANGSLYTFQYAGN